MRRWHDYNGYLAVYYNEKLFWVEWCDEGVVIKPTQWRREEREECELSGFSGLVYNFIFRAGCFANYNYPQSRQTKSIKLIKQVVNRHKWVLQTPLLKNEVVLPWD